MKRTISYILSALILTSCADDKLPVHDAVGRISVELMAEPPVKAPVALTVDEAAGYHISVLNADGSPAVYESPDDRKGQQIQTVDFKDFETVTVSLGKQYQVTAESCTVEESEAGYGCARYEGNSGLFALNASNIYQKAVINCSQTNALVTVVFDPSVSGRFTGLKMTLSSGERTLTIAESAEDADAYFTPAALSYTISGTYTETSFPVRITPETISLEAKDNIRLVVKLDLTHGQTDMPSLSVTEEYAHEAETDCVIDPYKSL